MPYKPKRPCRYPSCSRIARDYGQYCDEHRKLTDRQYDKYQRGYKASDRYGTKWRRIRSRYIKSHPLCEECCKNGRFTPAAEVHHILPLGDGGTNDFTNLRSLCKSCHSSHHLSERNANRGNNF